MILHGSQIIESLDVQFLRGPFKPALDRNNNTAHTHAILVVSNDE